MSCLSQLPVARLLRIRAIALTALQECAGYFIQSAHLALIQPS
jgi:hypothetical protein